LEFQYIKNQTEIQSYDPINIFFYKREKTQNLRWFQKHL
jgi:hypothetical protein